MTFEAIYSRANSIPGWMGEPDCFALYEHTKDLHNALIVEIGAFMGKSTVVMALSSPTSRVVTIDPYSMKYDIGMLPTQHQKQEYKNPDNVYEQCRGNVFGLNVEIIRDTSENVGNQWKKKIDFLHIDGDHHYENVVSDIRLFVPFVKKDKYVFLHDYVVESTSDDPLAFGVKKAIEQIGSKYFSEVTTVSGFACCKKL